MRGMIREGEAAAEPFAGVGDAEGTDTDKATEPSL